MTGNSHPTYAELVAVLKPSGPKCFPDPSGDGIDHGIIDTLLELAAQETLNHEMLKSAVSLADPRYFEGLLRIFGKDAVLKFVTQKQRPVSFKSLFTRGCFPLIRLLHETGIPLDKYTKHGLSSALRSNEPENVELLLSIDPKFSLADRNPIHRILACPPECAAVMTDFARRAISDEASRAKLEYIVFQDAGSCRIMHEPKSIRAGAFLVSAGLIPREKPAYSPNILVTGFRNRIWRQSQSAHSQIELVSQEPDPADILMRSPDAAFFGESALQRMRKILQ